MQVPTAALPPSSASSTAMGIPLVAGRDFTEADAEGAPFIVNEYLARELLPDRDPMGQRLPGAETPVTMVGVAKNSWQTRYHAPVEGDSTTLLVSSFSARSSRRLSSAHRATRSRWPAYSAMR